MHRGPSLAPMDTLTSLQRLASWAPLSWGPPWAEDGNFWSPWLSKALQTDQVPRHLSYLSEHHQAVKLKILGLDVCPLLP